MINKCKTHDQVFAIMKESFPEDEFRAYIDQKNILKDTRYKLISEDDLNGNILGFLTFWELKLFNFVEHIAVKPNLRGKGLGSNLIRKYLDQSNGLTVLEVELPNDKIKVRRIKFYENLGFKLNLYFYNQPSFIKGNEDVPMYIMSFPNYLNLDEFIYIRKDLNKYIYLRDF